MGDSWEDEDFEVPVIQEKASSPVPGNWDEEDNVELEAKVAKPTAQQLEAAAKRAQEEEQKFESKIKNAVLKSETAEERKAREKKEVEEGDQQLASEIFGGEKAASGDSKSAKGLGSIALKTKQDHTAFGTLVSQRLAVSSGFNVAAFYKSLSVSLQNEAVSGEVIDEIMNDIKKIRETKQKADKSSKSANTKKSKKDLAAESKKHADVFGGSEFVDKYANYDDMEDEFM